MVIRFVIDTAATAGVSGTCGEQAYQLVARHFDCPVLALTQGLTHPMSPRLVPERIASHKRRCKVPCRTGEASGGALTPCPRALP
jgi:hypothetical protein